MAKIDIRNIDNKYRFDLESNSNMARIGHVNYLKDYTDLQISVINSNDALAYKKSNFSGYISSAGTPTVANSDFYNSSGVKTNPIVTKTQSGIYEVDFSNLFDIKGNPIDVTKTYTNAVEKGELGIKPDNIIKIQLNVPANTVTIGISNGAGNYVDKEFFITIDIYNT